jgi:membrane associated rhomboid family serine protease
MRQASVGFHCPECTKQGAQKIIRPGQLITRPVVSQVLIGISVAVFVYGLAIGQDQLIVDGALAGPLVAAGDWYRIVTSGFIHFGIVHLGFNMLLLYRLGELIEPELGRVRFTLVYAASLLCGSVGVLLMSPDAYTAGASGAVFGMAGYAFMSLRARGIDPFLTSIGSLVVMNLVFTFAFARYVSVGGHLGGLAGGMLCGWIATDFGPKVLKDKMVITGALATVAAVAGASALLIA